MLQSISHISVDSLIFQTTLILNYFYAEQNCIQAGDILIIC